jgi:hypothetical protein
MVVEVIKIFHPCMENGIQYHIHNSPPLIGGMSLNVMEKWAFEISENTGPLREGHVLEVNNAFVMRNSCLRAEDNN